MLEKLATHLPKSVYDELSSVVSSGVSNPLRMAHFLAQVAHESGNFAHKSELLSYSKDGLLKTFPKYFDAVTALQYERQSERIANRVYANRMGNGDEKSGDGWRYRGRGYIQLTGKNNYTDLDKVISGVLATPDLVASKHPLLSAAWFWNSRKLNTIADKGSSIETITEITKKVNGGTHGLQDRINKFNLYFKVLTA